MSAGEKTTFIYILLSPTGDPARGDATPDETPVDAEDPTTWHGRVFYVGKANQPRFRLAEHKCDRKRSTAKGRWLAGLHAAGLRPVLAIVEECGYSAWQEREVYWQNTFLERGEPLTNMAECGMGAQYGLFKHGMAGTREYFLWHQIKARCADPNDRKYGSRGIKLCEAWQEFGNFLADMGLSPSKKHILHRLDKSGDYTPGNCKWLTVAEARLLPPYRTDGTKFLTIEECAARLELSPRTVRRFVKSGALVGETCAQRWFIQEDVFAAFLETFPGIRPRYTGLKDPEGTLICPFQDLRQFCKERGLHYPRMNDLYHGKILCYRGWTCVRPEAQAALAARKWTHTPETIAKIRAAAEGRTYRKHGPISEEKREKISKRLLENGKNKNPVTIDGVTQSLHQWTKHFGISHATVQSRLRSGWDLETALRTPAGDFGTAKEWRGFVRPDGTDAGIIHDLRKFSEENALSYQAMIRLHRGESRSHQGWTCPSSARPVKKPGARKKTPCLDL